VAAIDAVAAVIPAVLNILVPAIASLDPDSIDQSRGLRLSRMNRSRSIRRSSTLNLPPLMSLHHIETAREHGTALVYQS